MNEPTVSEQIRKLRGYDCGTVILSTVREMHQRYSESQKRRNVEPIPLEQFACECGDRYMPFWFKPGDIVSPVPPDAHDWKYGVVVDVEDNVGNRLGAVEIRTDDGKLRHPCWYELTRSDLPREILNLAKAMVTPECPLISVCPVMSRS